MEKADLTTVLRSLSVADKEGLKKALCEVHPSWLGLPNFSGSEELGEVMHQVHVSDVASWELEDVSCVRPGARELITENRALEEEALLFHDLPRILSEQNEEAPRPGSTIKASDCDVLILASGGDEEFLSALVRAKDEGVGDDLVGFVRSGGSIVAVHLSLSLNIQGSRIIVCPVSSKRARSYGAGSFEKLLGTGSRRIMYGAGDVLSVKTDDAGEEGRVFVYEAGAGTTDFQTELEEALNAPHNTSLFRVFMSKCYSMKSGLQFCTSDANFIYRQALTFLETALRSIKDDREFQSQAKAIITANEELVSPCGKWVFDSAGDKWEASSASTSLSLGIYEGLGFSRIDELYTSLKGYLVQWDVLRLAAYCLQYPTSWDADIIPWKAYSVLAKAAMVLVMVGFTNAAAYVQSSDGLTALGSTIESGQLKWWFKFKKKTPIVDRFIEGLMNVIHNFGSRPDPTQWSKSKAIELYIRGTVNHGRAYQLAWDMAVELCQIHECSEFVDQIKMRFEHSLSIDRLLTEAAKHKSHIEEVLEECSFGYLEKKPAEILLYRPVRYAGVVLDPSRVRPIEGEGFDHESASFLHKPRLRRKKYVNGILVGPGRGVDITRFEDRLTIRGRQGRYNVSIKEGRVLANKNISVGDLVEAIKNLKKIKLGVFEVEWQECEKVAEDEWELSNAMINGMWAGLFGQNAAMWLLARVLFEDIRISPESDTCIPLEDITRKEEGYVLKAPLASKLIRKLPTYADTEEEKVYCDILNNGKLREVTTKNPGMLQFSQQVVAVDTDNLKECSVLRSIFVQ